MNNNNWNNHSFQHALLVSYNLWPLEDQKTFLHAISFSLNRNDGVQLKKTFDTHLRRIKINGLKHNLKLPKNGGLTSTSKFKSTNLLSSNLTSSTTLYSSTSETVSLFSSLKHERDSATLPQYEKLINYFKNADTTQHFSIVVHHIFPILINENRWDLIKFFSNSLSWAEKETDFGNLPGNVLQKIFKKLDSPSDLLNCAHVNNNWRKFAGRAASWEQILMEAARDVDCLKKQVTIWREQELSVDAEPLRYFNLYEMLKHHSKQIIEMDEKKERKRVNLKKLNLRHLKSQQRERRLRKIQNSQHDLFNKLMIELHQAFKTNPIWKNHLMKEYRAMYEVNKHLHVEKMLNFKYLKSVGDDKHDAYRRSTVRYDLVFKNNEKANIAYEEYYRGSIIDYEENVVHDYSKHKRKSIYKKPVPSHTKTQSFSFMKHNPKINSKGNHFAGSSTSSKLTSHTSFAKFTKDATFEMSETGLKGRQHKVSIARDTCLKGIPHAAPLGGGIPDIHALECRIQV